MWSGPLRENVIEEDSHTFCCIANNYSVQSTNCDKSTIWHKRWMSDTARLEFASAQTDFEIWIWLMKILMHHTVKKENSQR